MVVTIRSSDRWCLHLASLGMAAIVLRGHSEPVRHNISRVSLISRISVTALNLRSWDVSTLCRLITSVCSYEEFAMFL